MIPDQWGQKIHKHISPLLHGPAVSELIVSENIRPFHAWYVLLVYDEILCGGIRMALGKDLKPGTRHIVIWGCLVSAIVSLNE